MTSTQRQARPYEERAYAEPAGTGELSGEASNPHVLDQVERFLGRFIAYPSEAARVAPIPVSRVSHRCPARGYDRRVLREAGE